MAELLDRSGRRSVASQVSMSLDAWTALDLMAIDDGLSVSKVLNRLVNAEAKRRLELKAQSNGKDTDHA